MHALEELKEKLICELEECGEKDISTSNLDVIDKLAHAAKCVQTVIAMEEAGYSNESGYSYARGRGSYARRDSMGRYSNRGSYDMPYDRRGYSRKDAKEDLTMDLNDLKMRTRDPEMVHMIDKFIKQVEE